jgi:hypothetical protein
VGCGRGTLVVAQVGVHLVGRRVLVKREQGSKYNSEPFFPLFPPKVTFFPFSEMAIFALTSRALFNCIFPFCANISSCLSMSLYLSFFFLLLEHSARLYRSIFNNFLRQMTGADTLSPLGPKGGNVFFHL